MFNLRPVLQKYWELFTDKNDKKRIGSQTSPKGISVFSDIPYINDGKWQHTLEIYRPENADRPLPVIIDIHGGGWMYGTTHINKHYNMMLASEGYTVFSINYRLVPECEIDGQLRDCMHALNWIKKHAEEYLGNLSELFITGDSAGGFLAAYSVLLNNSETLRQAFHTVSPELDFKALGLTCPVCYLDYKAVQGVYMRQILADNYKFEEYGKYVNLDQALNVSTLPPTYLITSGGDMPAKKATFKAYEDIEDRHIECKLKYIPDKKKTHVFNIVDPFSAQSKDVNRDMLKFFNTHI